MSRFVARDKLSREVSQGLNCLARSGQNVRVNVRIRIQSWETCIISSQIPPSFCDNKKSGFHPWGGNGQGQWCGSF